MHPIIGGPATSLDDLHRTLRPDPLVDPQEFRTFYRPDVNRVRGEDTVARLSLKLRQAHGALPFRSLLMGHRGVGKSTEITRLLECVEAQYAGVRLSVANELNPASFKVFDVLLLMLARLAEEANRLQAIPLQGVLSGGLFSDIEHWFAAETEKNSGTRTIGAGVEAGVGAKEGSPWAALLGLFASAKLEMKYAAERKSESIEYRLKRLPDLVGICNRLIHACEERLKDRTGKEWILVIEDLDKTSISPQQLQELFIQYGNVFQDLQVSMIFTIPVWLAYSSERPRLPFECHMIHDTPVYDRGHATHAPGREAVLTVLEARVSPTLVAEGQATRLIVASGGNLRDLFALVLDAGERAALREVPQKVLGPEDAQAAIANMRRDYRMRLGESPYDAVKITYADKVSRLMAVYTRAPDHDVPDPVLYSLLRASAVQEFNGTGWYAVHPLVVDILKDQGHLKPQDPGGAE